MPRDSTSTAPASCASISIIIPALNEAAELPGTLAALCDADILETIVVDGGSRDDTVAIATAHGARVLASQPGRGKQMHVGALAARGEILLFLHADTRLPQRFDEAVRSIMRDPNVAAGAFRLRINASGLGCRIIEWGVRIRSEALGRPWGDQVIFLRASDYRAVGGFPDVPIMEDVELLAALRRRGRVRVCRLPVSSSARRWRRGGVLRTTLRNQACLLLRRFGVSHQRIARWYARGFRPRRDAADLSGDSAAPGRVQSAARGPE